MFALSIIYIAKQAAMLTMSTGQRFHSSSTCLDNLWEILFILAFEFGTAFMLSFYECLHSSRRTALSFIPYYFLKSMSGLPPAPASVGGRWEGRCGGICRRLQFWFFSGCAVQSRSGFSHHLLDSPARLPIFLHRRVQLIINQISSTSVKTRHDSHHQSC